MKRLIALLLALVLALSLVACAEEEEPTSRRRKKNKETTTEVTEEPTEETQEETTEEPTEEETEPEEEEVSPEGVFDGDRYESAYFGFVCQLPEDWEFMPDKDITKQYGTPTTIAEMGAYGIIYDMVAAGLGYSDRGFTANVSVLIQSENFLSKSLSDEKYAEASMEGGIASLENVGATNIESQITTWELAGRERITLILTSDVQGFHVYQAMIFIRDGEYTGAVTITTTSEENARAIAAFFTELN